MTETNNTSAASTEGQPADTTQQAPTVETLQAEVEKWKNLSRTNEKRWNDSSAELDRIRQESMTDAEKAVEAAKAEARSAAFAEVGTQLAEAELRAQAASAGVELPSADFLNLNRFIGSDGSVDSSAVSAFVSSLPKSAAGPAFRQDIGLGRQGSPAPGQFSRDDLSRMSPKEINEARKTGKLDALMKGDL